MPIATVPREPTLIANDAHLEADGAATPTDLPTRVRGLAIPFNDTEHGQSGFLVDEDGALRFFAYTVIRPGAYDLQIAEPNFGGRVRFMWNHGGRDAHGTWAGGSDDGARPIGNVTELVSIPAGIMFAAEFNDTAPALETRKAVQAGSVQEVSVLTQHIVASIKTDDEGIDFLDVTQSRMWDVSLVTRAQYPQTRIFSANCLGCDSTILVGAGSDGQFQVQHEGDSCHVVTLTPDLEANAGNPPNDHNGDGDVTLTRQQIGSGFARIDQLENALRSHQIEIPAK